MRSLHIRPLLATLCVAAGTLLFPAESNAQNAAELLEKGHEAYLDYDFDEAARLYAAAKKKAKRGDTDFTDRYDKWNRQLTTAGNFLDRVEKIVIIDSITVPRQEFFKAYRLPASAGRLSGAEGMPEGNSGDDYVFTNEGDDYKIWAERDTTGHYRLTESTRLTDGSWSRPSHLPDALSEDGDETYPFMMADGVTLYYADNGENSIGGYDIMVATRDAADGTFLQPQNLGFPYNSPYDDFLLAIDELNGVGWWATDRNQLEDDLTVYVFVTNDLRQNYSPDEDDVVSFARIDDYIMTQPEDSDYSDLLATIRSIDPETAAITADFHFPMPGGQTYTSYDDFTSLQARNLMKRYMDSLEAFDDNAAEIDGMRREFHRSGSATLGRRIAKAEAEQERDRETLRKMRSDIYRLESKR